MCDVMTEALSTTRLSQLSDKTSYVECHEAPTILIDSVACAEASDLPLPIALNEERFIDSHVDNFIRFFLDKKTETLHDVTWYFNVIKNVFDAFFSKSLKMPNNLKQSCDLSLRKLRGEGTPAEAKKDLG